jgi:RND family efflux transporter MFP subunit
LLYVLVGVAAVLLGACEEEKNTYVPPPPPEVNVANPVLQPVTDFLELTGNTSSAETVDLMARVEGYLVAVNFEDGATVKKGDLLFVIEPKPYAARVQLAEATVANREAVLQRAEQEYARQLRLIKENATAVSEVERWKAERDAAKADLEESRADLDLARITYSYTHVTAPFTGRIGRRLKDPGNVVGAGGLTKIATLERLDPIYAYFNANERDVLRIREMRRARGYADYRTVDVPVFIGLQIEQGYPHRGRLDFVATGIDPGTGTVQMRGVFPNGQHALAPGLFVRVRIPIDVREQAVLVPDRSLGTDQGGRYVLVVNADGIVDQRTVETGARIGDFRVIDSGLAGDELIVVEGIQRARPGAKITPVKKDLKPPESSLLKFPAGTVPTAAGPSVGGETGLSSPTSAPSTAEGGDPRSSRIPQSGDRFTAGAANAPAGRGDPASKSAASRVPAMGPPAPKPVPKEEVGASSAMAKKHTGRSTDPDEK